MLDNVADLLLAVTLLHTVFEFPTDFALSHMVPGTALGVLVGDLLFFVLALRLIRITGRSDITAMPLGLDTPSTIGMVFLVLGPAYTAALSEGLETHAAALRTWHIGICCIVVSGVFKLACSAAANWIRRNVPRAGLLGSLAAIALVLISFLPLWEMLHTPLVAMLCLTMILLTLVARAPLRIPGTLATVLVGAAVFFALYWLGEAGVTWFGRVEFVAAEPWRWFPTEWLGVFTFAWVGEMGRAAAYFPVVIPFALATVVGGIDCTESAAAAGDEYDTRQIIGVEAVATLIAGLCGGVIQSTPYIGHPAYKAMGGRAAYALATALFIGTAGVFGYFAVLYTWIPKATVYPILVFIGLEITSQSFAATRRRHYPAIALACAPALAYLGQIVYGKFAVWGAELSDFQRHQLLLLNLMANGFLITSVIWASSLAAMIDGRLRRAAGFLLAGAACTAVGLMHSPLEGGAMHLPLTRADGVWQWSGPFLDPATADPLRGLLWGYVASALMLLGCDRLGIRPPLIDSDSEHSERSEHSEPSEHEDHSPT